MYTDLKNKTVVITGGSKGIGTAIAERLGKEQMNVVVNYHSDEEGAKEVVDEIKAQGSKALAVQADVGTEKGVEELLNAALEEFGGLDLWINNAGMENRHKTHELSLEDWQKCLMLT